MFCLNFLQPFEECLPLLAWTDCFSPFCFAYGTFLWLGFSMELTKVMTLFSLSTCLFYSCSLLGRQARGGHNPNSAWAAGHPKLSYGDPTLPYPPPPGCKGNSKSLAIRNKCHTQNEYKRYHCSHKFESRTWCTFVQFSKN